MSIYLYFDRKIRVPLFFRDIEQLNTLDNEEAGLALLSELLDLGLSNDVPEAPKILPNNVVDVMRESGEFKTFLRLATKLNVLETLQKLPQGTLLRGIDNKTVRRKFVYISSLLSNRQFIRKQNGSKLQFLK